MKKNDKIFNKAVEKLQKTGKKASEALDEVVQACQGLKCYTGEQGPERPQGLKAMSIDIDELSRPGSVTSALQEKVTKEMIENAAAQIKPIEKIESEEWIWVTGYKGTDKDMKCRDYQFMPNYRHTMLEGSEIKLCECGFHFCPKLKDVFGYYSIEKGNRFFEVRALVRKKDYEDTKERKKIIHHSIYGFWPAFPSGNDKLTSKAIEFVRELTLDEIFDGTDAAGWSEENKKLALEVGIAEARLMKDVSELVSLGYSEQLSNYIVRELKKYNLAKFLCTLPENPSMDTKMIILFGAENDCKDATIDTYNLYAMGKWVAKGLTDGVSTSKN